LSNRTIVTPSAVSRSVTSPSYSPGFHVGTKGPETGAFGPAIDNLDDPLG
jgi:hypothetical protein